MVTFVGFLAAAAAGLEAVFEAALVVFSDLVVFARLRELFTQQPMQQTMTHTTSTPTQMMRNVKSGFFWQKLSGVFHCPLPLTVAHLRFISPS